MAEANWLEKSASIQQALLAIYTYFMLVSYPACSLTVKMDATCSSDATAFTDQHSIISHQPELFIMPCVPNVLKRMMKSFVKRGEGVYGLKGYKTLLELTTLKY
jgi:hypothetical protein